MSLPCNSKELPFTAEFAQSNLSEIEFRRYRRLSSRNDRQSLNGPTRRARLEAFQVRLTKLYNSLLERMKENIEEVPAPAPPPTPAMQLQYHPSPAPT